MAPFTFILTRAFFITSLVVAALPAVFAAPVPAGDVAVVEKRYLGACAWGGCMFAKPSSTDTAVVATPTPSAAPSLVDIIVAAVEAATDQDKDPKTDTFVHVATNNSNTDDDDKPSATVKIIELNIPGADSSDDKPKPAPLADLLESLPKILDTREQNDFNRPTVRSTPQEA